MFEWGRGLLRSICYPTLCLRKRIRRHPNYLSTQPEQLQPDDRPTRIHRQLTARQGSLFEQLSERLTAGVATISPRLGLTPQRCGEISQFESEHNLVEVCGGCGKSQPVRQQTISDAQAVSLARSEIYFLWLRTTVARPWHRHRASCRDWIAAARSFPPAFACADGPSLRQRSAAAAGCGY